MGKKGAKKQILINNKIKKRLLYTMLISNLFYIIFKLVLRFKKTSKWCFVGLIVSDVAYFLCKKFIWGYGKPIFDQQGRVIDGGKDLSETGGMIQYFFDIIYITAFVHVTATFHSAFWLFFLVVPCYAVYKIFVQFIWPNMKTSNEAQPEQPQQDFKFKKGYRQQRKMK
ncbi:transmembrane protein [Anaeramoeba flamelloides]|uniref:Transmembrane protein n=1 Tax=Anaeramoeba flamelloides TaxID=1746091 RepID=A0AAV7YP91_9EUKA|nr:transmembrane protein [Anaeramoeba flamelloides]